jgi:hypothetical protein
VCLLKKGWTISLTVTFGLAEADTGVLLLRNTDWTRALYGRIRSMLDSRSMVDKVAHGGA